MSRRTLSTIVLCLAAILAASAAMGLLSACGTQSQQPGADHLIVSISDTYAGKGRVDVVGEVRHDVAEVTVDGAPVELRGESNGNKTFRIYGISASHALDVKAKTASGQEEAVTRSAPGPGEGSSTTTLPRDGD